MIQGDTLPADVDRAGGAEGVRRLLANALALLLAYVLPRLFTVGAVVVAARVLGTSAFGAYGTAAAFAVVLSIIATLGMTPLLVREMAQSRTRAPALIRAAHITKTVSNLLMLATLFVVGRAFFADPAVLGAALLLGIAYAIGAYVENLAAWVQSIERMHLWTQASAAYGLVTGVVGALLVIGTRSVVWFCVAPVLGQLAALAWLMKCVPAPIRLGTPAAPGDVRRLLLALAPFAAAFVGLTLHSKADVLLLSRLRPAADVGLYTAGYKFIDVTQALAVITAAAVFPRLSRHAPVRTEAARWAGTRLVELALLAAVPAAAILVLGRAVAVPGLYGEAYAASIPVVLFLGTAIPFLVVNIVGGYILGAAGEMHRVAVLYALAVPAKLGLNAWLVPVHGATGAAMAMLATETALCAAMLYVLHRHAHAAPVPRVWLTAALTAVLAAVLAQIPAAGAGLSIAAFLVLVAALYAAANVVPSRERALLRDALRVGRGAVPST